MQLPSNVPVQKQGLLEQLVTNLSRVSNVQAIVLGGSYASGTQSDSSDLDIGLYYYAAKPFSIGDIRRIAQEISCSGSTPTVTGFYVWGAWVNGGAWIQTEAGKVDFLYRNLDQVRTTIEDAQQGIMQHDYDQQPTTGFYSVGYLAETQICIPLYDPAGQLAELKRQVAVYPAALKRNTIAGALWGAEFTLQFARDYAVKADVYNTVGCMVRAAASMTQALFALNERYFISDKRAMATIAAFGLLPPNYVVRIESILSCPGSTADELTATVAQLEAAWRSLVTLTEGTYQPQFVL